MFSDLALEAENLGKAYLIYQRPEDRLKQMIFRRRKYYEEYWAVRDINLKISKGEAVGIIGRNGAGKSTFLQLAVGVIAPTTGTIAINGRVAALLELGAGFNPEFTGAENVYLSAAILGLSQEEIKDRFGSIAEFAAIAISLTFRSSFIPAGCMRDWRLLWRLMWMPASWSWMRSWRWATPLSVKNACTLSASFAKRARSYSCRIRRVRCSAYVTGRYGSIAAVFARTVMRRSSAIPIVARWKPTRTTAVLFVSVAGANSDRSPRLARRRRLW